MQTQIFPPPDQPLQYRAIGLVRGKYIPSQQRFNKGTLLTSDGTAIDAVLLGQVMSLAQRLDLEQEQWWVVYPRTRAKAPHLHVQVLGVRNPQLQNTSFIERQFSSALVNEADAFSVRGEVVNQDAQARNVIIKIRQAPRKLLGRVKTFRLTLNGFLPPEAVGWFWDLQVQREGESLVIEDGQAVSQIFRQPQPRRPQLRRTRHPS